LNFPLSLPSPQWREGKSEGEFDYWNIGIYLGLGIWLLEFHSSLLMGIEKVFSKE
jgi:hypothetical protein